MNSHNIKQLIKRAELDYKKIKSVKCPALNNDDIVFNNHGFNHIIRKGKVTRALNIQVERMNLIKFVPEILINSKNFSSHRKSIDFNGSVAYFWCFKDKIGDKNLKLIVRQIGNGVKHFFSIFQESAKTSPK